MSLSPSDLAVLATLKELVTIKLAGDTAPTAMVAAMPWEARPVYALGANLSGHLVTMLADALNVPPLDLWQKILVTSAVLGFGEAI